MNINIHIWCSAFFLREKYLFKNRTAEVPPNSYYHSLYPKIIQDIEVSLSEKYLWINWPVCADFVTASSVILQVPLSTPPPIK